MSGWRQGGTVLRWHAQALDKRRLAIPASYTSCALLQVGARAHWMISPIWVMTSAGVYTQVASTYTRTATVMYYPRYYARAEVPFTLYAHLSLRLRAYAHPEEVDTHYTPPHTGGTL